MGVRPGLVFTGGVLALLGVATIATFSFLATTSHNTTEFVTPPLAYAGHASGATLLTGSDTGSGSLSVGWHSSSSLNVSLYSAPGCRVATVACASGPALAGWAVTTSGNWSTHGSLAFPFLVVWSSVGPLGGNITVSGTETTDVVVSPPLLTTLLIDGAGGVLAVIGGVAIFLGLFLRGGVYAGPPRITSRSAEDLEDAPPSDGPR